MRQVDVVAIAVIVSKLSPLAESGVLLRPHFPKYLVNELYAYHIFVLAYVSHYAAEECLLT
jgi:hypothetical protein